MNTVGCRIRIDTPLSTVGSSGSGDSTPPAIGFYPSSTKDSNQFVCVLRHEYGVEASHSGCVRRGVGGRLRCWCYGESDCNTEENSLRIYRDFLAAEPTKDIHIEDVVAVRRTYTSRRTTTTTKTTRAMTTSSAVVTVATTRARPPSPFVDSGKESAGNGKGKHGELWELGRSEF